MEGQQQPSGQYLPKKGKKRARRDATVGIVDPNLANEPLNESDVASFSYVVSVEGADTHEFDSLKAVKVKLYDAKTKSTVERLISGKVFKTINRFKAAWKNFHGIPTVAKKQKLGPEERIPLVPDSTPPPDGPPPRRLRRAERILSQRTQRIVIVLERCRDNHNQQAVLRTAELLGVQHVWMILSSEMKQEKFVANRRVTRGSDDWLTIRTFNTTKECIIALREDKREIWVTELSQRAVPLDSPELKLPPKMALIIGREADGVSQEFLNEADQRVFMPMYGFSDSFNLSVATALVLQRLFAICPEARGDLSAEERHTLRCKWYSQLSTTDEHAQLYAKYINNPPPPLEDVRGEDKDRIPRVKKKIYKRMKMQEELKEKEFAETMKNSKGMEEDEGEEEEKEESEKQT